MKETEQITRIREMEQALNTGKAAVEQLDKALGDYGEAMQSLAALADYYGSEEWMKDFEDDEKGLLPPAAELPRGVLSEDGIYNVLVLEKELLEQMLELASRYIRESL